MSRRPIVAECVCGATFRSGLAAARHYRDSGHRTWTISGRMLAGNPWTLDAMMRTHLERAGEPVDSARQ